MSDTPNYSILYEYKFSGLVPSAMANTHRVYIVGTLVPFSISDI